MSIQPSIFNAVNFTPDFNRESKFFDVNLQRKRNIISSTANSSGCYMYFYFKPAVVPGAAPAVQFVLTYSDGSSASLSADRTLTMTDGYIYFFTVARSTPKAGKCTFLLTISGYTDVCYSEECEFILATDLVTESVVEIIAYNNDETHGYISSTYKTCAFFQVHELNNKVFGNNKVEYNLSYGRKKILSSENFIKTRLTFIDLTMYQQNLLKTLCNCENLTINGVAYYLVSDFTEISKDENNEICDLRAEFIETTNPTFFAVGATQLPGNLQPSNLFNR
jgi:hypothetical protein